MEMSESRKFLPCKQEDMSYVSDPQQAPMQNSENSGSHSQQLRAFNWVNWQACVFWIQYLKIVENNIKHP